MPKAIYLPEPARLTEVNTPFRLLVTVLLIYFGLAGNPQVWAASPDFQHPIAQEPYPWTDRAFDISPDRFMFAIHADLTGGERDPVFQIAMAQLALLRPEFIISVGDLVEGGVKERDALDRQWDWFDQRARAARAKLFYVGGNHDLTSPLERKVWSERHGSTYYHFRYQDVLFLVLDTEDNPAARVLEIERARSAAVKTYRASGRTAFENTEYARMPERTAGTIGQEQSRYFQSVLTDHTDVRWTFLFLHKPAWRREGDTPFTELETALADRSYTVFNGHVQAYQHERRHGRDYIQLATTGGQQFPDIGWSVDHVTLVTVSGADIDVVNLSLSGIRDATGNIPLDSDGVCFDTRSCVSSEAP